MTPVSFVLAVWRINLIENRLCGTCIAAILVKTFFFMDKTSLFGKADSTDYCTKSHRRVGYIIYCLLKSLSSFGVTFKLDFGIRWCFGA